nr:element excision factor XisH family protein [Hassalia byssoidea]
MDIHLFYATSHKIGIGGVNMSIDLAAEKLIAAEREGEKIAVEVKSFLERSSAISEFHTALGQFINYRGALRRREPERILYLAVPLTTYKTFFQLDFPKEMVLENQVKMIIYDIKHEVIAEWKN